MLPQIMDSRSLPGLPIAESYMVSQGLEVLTEVAWIEGAANSRPEEQRTAV
jgi:hypothetical protein